MKRILFIPSDHGGGKGHASRALYLAKTAQAQGYETGIVLEKKHICDAGNAGIPGFLLDTRMERIHKYQFKKPFKPNLKLKTNVSKRPVFVEFASLAWQVPRDGYWSEKLVRYRMKQLRIIVEQFKPDVLIGDTHFLTFLLGKKFEIPVLQVTRFQGWPPKADFLWWKNSPAEINAPLALHPFEGTINELQLAPAEKAEDLLKGDRYLIPSNKELEPVRRGKNSLFYCGTLAEAQSEKRSIPFFNRESDIPKIYVTIGGGAERGQLEAFFQQILSVFDHSDYRVLVSTGGRVPAKKFKGQSVNVVFEDWVDGTTAIRQSDLVVHHGGYATTMETLLSRKPALVIPSHSEQEGNGRRLEELGLGKTILPYQEKLQMLEFEWPYGVYEMGAAFQLKLDASEIHDAINTLLYGGTYPKLEKMSASLHHLRTRFNLEKVFSF